MKQDQRWASVYRSFNVISPWTVGRFANEPEVGRFAHDFVQPDIAETHRAGIRYMPVAFPGYTHSNAARMHGKSEDFNGIPRHCGRFFWRQISAFLHEDVDALYVAMFDEVGEGTAVFPLETSPDNAIAGAALLKHDQDGCTVPDDWYLRVAGIAGEFLGGKKRAPMDLDAVLKPPR